MLAKFSDPFVHSPAVASLLERELTSARLRASGPIVPVEIRGVDADGNLSEKVVYGDAELDTGADATAADDKVFQDLQHTSTGSMWAQGVTSEPLEIPTYAIHIKFVDSTLPSVVFGRAASVPHLDAGTGRKVLVGRDFTSKGTLVVDGPNGRFAFLSGEPSGGLLTVEPQGIPASALAAGLLFGAIVGGLAYTLKPEPPCALAYAVDVDRLNR